MESTRCEYTIRGETKYFNVLADKISAADAYLLGYLACDGGFVQAKRPGDRLDQPFIMVSSTEENIMEWIKENYIPCSTIMNVGKKSSAKVNATNDVFELRFSSRASKQFARFGVLTRKPDRRLVGIPKHHMHAYMAGVIEADGFISVAHRKDCRTPRLLFFITHSGEKFLADLQKWLPINTNLRQHGSNVWRLSAQETTQNKVFLYSVLPFMKNAKKKKILSDYLDTYYVHQSSGELLESESQSAAKPQ